jgi:uncharacterized repeat protein (TIGR01451 family)
MKWIRSFGFSLALLLLLGSAQDAGDIKTISPDENLSLDSSLRVPSASALPGEAIVNTVAPELGPGVNYTSIQEAIDNSDPGDVIRVQSGTYDEVVTVNKPGLSLEGVDSGDGKPVVSGDGVESTVTLASDGCTLEGFVIINSGNPHAGVFVFSNSNAIIGNTIVDNRGYGIHLDSSRNNSIWGNNVSANGFSGISLNNSSLNNLTSNIASENNQSGIELLDSSSNLILENLASENLKHGIKLNGSERNVLRRNIASNNTLEGISVEDSPGTVVVRNVVVEVKKSASEEEVGASTVVNFTIVVTNTGQVDFEKIDVADRLPWGLDYLSDNRSGDLDDGEVAWTLGPLASSESVTIELSAKIIGSTTGNLTNSVKATGETAGGVVVSKEASAVVSSLLVVGPNDSISKAIELARPGDVVLVQSGTYHDCIVLNKNITLKGVDTGGGPPVIAGDGVGSTITLMGDGCAIQGFEVTGSGNPHAGIEIYSNNNSISKNVIRGNRGYGVRIFEARENSVTSNEIRENGFDGVRWRPKSPSV